MNVCGAYVNRVNWKIKTSLGTLQFQVQGNVYEMLNNSRHTILSSGGTAAVCRCSDTGHTCKQKQKMQGLTGKDSKSKM
jgi:hypothetical protein